MKEIENWYDHLYDEWERLDRHRVEFDITKRFMDTYIEGQNLDIFDIGGGPGRYSFYLAEKGHKVSLLDLSGKNIAVAKEKSKELSIVLADFIQGNALELSNHGKTYDVILLMGPLYHLVNEEDRRLALKLALNLLKPGGVIFAAFISNYAPIQDYLSHFSDIEEVQGLLDYLNDGQNKEGEGFTTAYFSSQEEIKELMSDLKVDELAFVGVENILGCKERELLALSQDQYEKWIEIGYALSTDKNLMGTSQHFLYIGRKGDAHV
jgi:S-adenosylmethionine-dependent methyltransferase